MDRRIVPLALTFSRLPLAAVGYVAVAFERPGWVVTVALTAVGTDILDGFAARRLGVASKRGANLDSMVDFVFYASVLAWTVQLRPELLEIGLGPVIGALFAAYVLLFLGGLVLAHTVAVHTWMSRTVATVGTAVALYYIGFDFEPWLVVPVILLLLADVVQRAIVLGGHLRQSSAAP